MIEAVADRKLVRNLEPLVSNRQLDLAALRLRQQGAHLERRRWRAFSVRRRYESVSPESTMSSTIRTSRPSIDASRSFRILTTPLESVDEPYEATAMKSSSHGGSRWRIRSDRKKTAPLSTPTRNRSRPA